MGKRKPLTISSRKWLIQVHLEVLTGMDKVSKFGDISWDWIGHDIGHLFRAGLKRQPVKLERSWEVLRLGQPASLRS